MSDPVIIAIIGLLAIIVPAFFIQLTSIFLAWSARKEARDARKESQEARLDIKEDLKVTKEDIKVVVAETAKKVDETSVKLDTIHDQTNSNLTEIKKQLQVSIDENKALRKDRDEKAGAEGKARTEGVD